MIEKLSELKKDMAELATVLNQFKSEAVQLRLLELLFDALPRLDVKTKNAESTRKRPGDRPRSKRAAKLDGKEGAQGGGKEKPKKAGTGRGAAATLTDLLGGDFFKTHKTIEDIMEHSKHNLARSFKANEFSGKLARLIRSGELTRKKNADGQYEYKKP